MFYKIKNSKIHFSIIFSIIFVVLFCCQAFAGELRIAADEVFTTSMPELIKNYNSLYPEEKIAYKISPTPEFYNDVLHNGAKNYDVLISPDILLMNYLSDAKKFEIASRFTFGTVDAYLMTSDGSSIKNFNDIASDKVKSIACVKYSHMTRLTYTLLKNMKLFDKVEKKIVMYNSVEDAVNSVKSGKADCMIAIAPYSEYGLKMVAKTPEKAHMPVLCTGGIIRGTKEMMKATNFCYFLNTEPAKKILIKHLFNRGTFTY